MSRWTVPAGAPCIVAGSRSITRPRMVRWALNRAWVDGLRISELVEGEAPGIDRLSRAWAEGEGIAVKPMPADWNNLDAPNARIKERDGRQYNANAGFDRNLEMARYTAEHNGALVAIWDGISPGTQDMMESAVDQGVDPIHVFLSEDLETPLIRILNLKTDTRCLSIGEEWGPEYLGRAWADLPASPLGNPFYNQSDPGSTLPAYEEWLRDRLREKGSPQELEMRRLFDLAWERGVLELVCHCVTDLDDGEETAEGRCHCAVVRGFLRRAKRAS